MAGKDDLKLLATHVYSTLKPYGVDADEAEAVASVTMNNAIQSGSLPETIQMQASPDLMDLLQTGVPEKEEGKFNKVIQKAALMLRREADVTAGATEYYPKNTKVGKSSGLVKTHSTKNLIFCKPRPFKGRM